MAGSMKWFVYRTDDGADYAIKRDESRLEAVNGTANDYTTGSGVIHAVPRNIKPRTIRYSSSDGTVSTNVVALTPSLFLSAPEQFEDVNTGKVLTRRKRRPEEIALPYADDTGLTDGDAT